jgi:hypothetical protein
MATVAAAAAGDQGLEVVTDSSRVHAIASSRDEDAIYQTLFHDKSSAGISEPAMTLRLAHLVIVGGFDVSELSPEDLAKMSKNREALFDFRGYLAKLVGQIPEMDSELRRDAYLKAAAALDEWQKSVRNMSGFARRFFGIGLLDKSERAMTDLAKAGPRLAHHSRYCNHDCLCSSGRWRRHIGHQSNRNSGCTWIDGRPGGLRNWHGLKQEEMSGPLRYLSLLKQQGATLLVAAPPQRENASATA